MASAVRFEVLPGLPGIGPVPEQFSASGQGTFREGYVVRFHAQSETWIGNFHAQSETWIGNFQPGLTDCSTVIGHPDGEHAIVIAGGQGYVICPDTRRCDGTFGGQIEYIIAVQERDCIIFGNGLWFEGHGAGHKWRTRRLSWDGMRGLNLRGTTLEGEGWRFDGTWHPFSVNIETGEAVGGSYEEPSN